MAGSDEVEADEETMTDGAVKGGDGHYFFSLDDQDEVHAGGSYSSAAGGVVEGERHQAGLMTMEAGTTGDAHTHPNEQFIFVLSGRALFRVGDEEAEVSEGDLVFIPAEEVHSTDVLGDEDLRFLTTKDLSHGIRGTPVDE